MDHKINIQKTLNKDIANSPGTGSPMTSVTNTNADNAGTHIASGRLSPQPENTFRSYRTSLLSMNTINNVNKNVVNLHID